MLGYSKLENLSTQFFMVLIMRHLLLTFMHVCMLRLWESRITQNRNACRRCMPLSGCRYVPDRSCMMVAYPGVHQASEDSLLYRQYYRSTNLSKKQTHSTVFDSSMSKIRLRKLKFRYGVVNLVLCVCFSIN